MAEQDPSGELSSGGDDYRKSARCPGCKLPPSLCICRELPRITLPIRLIVIRHSRERHSQSNTGELVHRVFTNSQLVDYTDAMISADPARLFDGGADHRVLFPQMGARTLTADTFPSPERAALVVLDGRWSQARRMSRRVPGLRSFPFVAIPDAIPRFTLRRPRKPGQLSTAEAVGRALAILGHGEAAGELSRVLELLCERVLRVRGKPPSQPFSDGFLSLR